MLGSKGINRANVCESVGKDRSRQMFTDQIVNILMKETDNISINIAYIKYGSLISN